jgi:small subunit ribosomal protein S14
MAKESMKAREVKRAKLVAKYAEKRKALKEAGDWAALDKLPKNSSPCRLHNRCSLTGRLYASVRNQPYTVPRDGQQRPHPWRKEGQLVI